MTDYMLDKKTAGESGDLPWLVFKLHDLTYTINSRIVTSILQLTENITPVASAPDVYRGVYNFRGNALPLLDLRKVFGMKSSSDECEIFTQMIKDRKQDHINYVNELERCLTSNQPFTLTLDPHSCKLGVWLDSLDTVSSNNAGSIKKYLSMNDLLKFHANIHLLAKEITEHKADCANCKRTECLKVTKLNEIKKNRDKVLSMLDEVIKTFMSAVREMIVVISDENVSLGLIVDEVVAVDKLDILSDAERFPNFQKTRYFTGIAESAKIEGEILLVSEAFLLGMFEQYNK